PRPAARWGRAGTGTTGAGRAPRRCRAAPPAGSAGDARPGLAPRGRAYRRRPGRCWSCPGRCRRHNGTRSLALSPGGGRVSVWSAASIAAFPVSLSFFQGPKKTAKAAMLAALQVEIHLDGQLGGRRGSRTSTATIVHFTAAARFLHGP